MVEAHTLLPSGLSARIIPDPFDRDAHQLLIDNVAQSVVYATRPHVLRYDYALRIAAVLNQVALRKPHARVLHLGAGGLSVPRWVAAQHPQMTQTIVEGEEGLVEFVVDTLPWPGSASAQFVTSDAHAAMERFVAASTRMDVIVHDVYVRLSIPEHLRRIEHFRLVHDALSESGVLILNVADDRELPVTREAVSTLTELFPVVHVLAPTSVLSGLSSGNAVVVAHRAAPSEGWAEAVAAQGPHPGALLRAAEFLAE